MPEHEVEKLLGGFAPDTLTQEERQTLFTAALHDQQLFNALADEQALKQLLADPAVRRRLLQALRQPSPWSPGGLLSWLDWFRHQAGPPLRAGLQPPSSPSCSARRFIRTVSNKRCKQSRLKRRSPRLHQLQTLPRPRHLHRLNLSATRWSSKRKRRRCQTRMRGESLHPRRPHYKSGRLPGWCAIR